jgi:branched-chain amino acid transport system substrate-binding protein
MHVSLGGVLSGETKNIVANSAESGILVLTPSASAMDAINKDNAFRVCFNDPQQGLYAAEIIKEKNLATKIALFYDNSNDYCVGNAETFKSKAAEIGLEIVKEQTYTEATNTDFSTQITAIKESGAELVFMPIYYSDAAKFLRQASSNGLDTVFFGVDGLDGGGLLGSSGSRGFQIAVNGSGSGSKIFGIAHLQSAGGQNQRQQGGAKYGECAAHI